MAYIWIDNGIYDIVFPCLEDDIKDNYRTEWKSRRKILKSKCLKVGEEQYLAPIPRLLNG